MFTIGEFSRIVGMSVKTLRFYHEEGLLVPASVDPRTNYRYYDERNLEAARLIAWLRGLEFSVNDIRELLQHAEHEGNLLTALERQKAVIVQRARKLKGVSRSLRQFIEREKQLQSAIASGQGVEEKDLAPMLIAGIRMTAPYKECGKGFARIGRRMGRFICGPPLLLHYDTEYQEDAADFEACFPIGPTKPAEGIDIRELPGATCASLLHQGPYDEMGTSYATVLKHVKQRGYTIAPPTREVYLKGPGMIFKGNPRSYITEIQIPIQTSASNQR
jgi:DNA-binding transcriptional MerR regulator/effector-binding domain-containing protein